MTQYNDILKAFGLANHINQCVNDHARDCLTLSDIYCTKKQELSKTLPYNINIIDELHVNENAHSRILAKLLQYQSEGEYIILQSFLKRIHKGDFQSIKIKKPEISHNKSFIDIWIQDEAYAIIIENKVYDAIDQDHQIARYIKTTKDAGYSEGQIYVIYMPNSIGEPANYSWVEDSYDYKDSFRNRYFSMSYQHVILPWLKGLQKIPAIQNELMIQSGLTQYIDYLEGLFLERKSQKPYYMNLKQTIKEHLKFDSSEDKKEQYDRLSEECRTFQEIINQMESLKNDIKRDIFIGYWEKHLPKQYNWRKTHPNNEQFLIGCEVKYRDDYYLLFIGDDGQLYCQLNSPNGRQRQVGDLLSNEELRCLLPKGNTEQPYIWNYYKGDDIEGVLNCLRKVIDVLDRLGCSFLLKSANSIE